MRTARKITANEAADWLHGIANQMQLYLRGTRTPIPVQFAELEEGADGRYSGGEVVYLSDRYLTNLTPERAGRMLSIYLHESTHYYTSHLDTYAMQAHGAAFSATTMALHWRALDHIHDTGISRAVYQSMVTDALYDAADVADFRIDGHPMQDTRLHRIGDWVQMMSRIAEEVADSALPPADLVREIQHRLGDHLLQQDRPRHWLARRIRRAASRPGADLLVEAATILLGGAALGVVGMAGILAFLG